MKITTTFFSMVPLCFLFLLFFSSLLYAGTATPPASACEPLTKNLPCAQQPTWELAIEGNYLRAIHTGAVTPEQTIQPDWAFGFRLDVAYHFSQGNDLNVNWTHFERRTSQDGTLLARDDVDFHAVNLEFGQRYLTGTHINTRFHFGLQYSYVRDDLTSWDQQAPPDVAKLENDSRFSGVGPRVGIDYAFLLNDRWGLINRSAAGLLVGNLSWEQTRVLSSDGDVLDTQSTTIKTRALVPVLESRFGVTYAQKLTTNGKVAVEGGYQFAGYFQSVRNRFANITNFGYHGPYLKVGWQSAL